MAISPSKIEHGLNLGDDTMLMNYTKIIEDDENEPSGKMKDVINYFKSIVSVTVATPFKGAFMITTNDEKQVLFSSKVGKFGLLDVNSNEVVTEEKVCECGIFALALTGDNKCVYIAEDNQKINKYLLPDLNEAGSFSGQTGVVNAMVSTVNDLYLFTASSLSEVTMWMLKVNPVASQVLYKCKGAVSCLDLSANEMYLSSGGLDGKIYIYELGRDENSSGKLLNSIDVGSEIWAVKLFPDASKVVCGDSLGNIRTFNLFTWDECAVYVHGGKVFSIDVSNNGSILATSGDNSLIKIWDVTGEHKEVTLKKHSHSVKTIKITKDQSRIISIGSDKTITISRIPSFEKVFIMNTDNIENILKFWTSKKTKRLEGIAKTTDNEFFLSEWDTAGNRTDCFTLGRNEPILAIYISSTSELVAFTNASPEEILDLQGEDRETYICGVVYSLPQRKKIRSYLLHSFNPTSGCVTPDLAYLVTGESFKISIWNYSDFSKVAKVFAHNGKILKLIISNDLLYTFGEDAVLKKFKCNFGNSENKLVEEDSLNFSGSVSSFEMDLSDDSKYMYLAFADLFQVVELDAFLKILTVEKSYIGMLKNVKGTLMLLSSDGIDIYSCKSLQLMCNYKRDFDILRVLVTENKKGLYIETSSELIQVTNPLNPDSITLVGDISDLDRFEDHVASILDKNCVEMFNGSQWLIEPQHINLIHLYAFFNMCDVIKDAIRGKEGCPAIAFFDSIHQFTPLSIAIQLNFSECIHSIITSLRKAIKSVAEVSPYRKFIFQYLESSLPLLNLTGYKGLHKLYRNILELDSSPYLPNFCEYYVKLPMAIRSNHLFLDADDFNLSSEIPEDGIAIVFYKSLIKIPMEMGSSKSLEFMKSLGDCSNEEIFETKLIKLILTQKWDSSKKYIWAQACLYIVYLLLLCLYTSFEPLRTAEFLLAPFIVSCLLYAYEMVFMIISISKYFQDFWNVVDSLRAWIMATYSVLVWVGYFSISATENTREKNMLAVLIFVSWMRGITYFRINAKTRYLIKLLFQVCIDIGAFLIILFYSILAFGLIFRAFDASESADFFTSITYSYMIIIGNWDNPTDPDFNSIITLLATILNPVVSLNLLISILSDTYAQVSQNQLVADSLELIEMIIEVETLMFWNRNKNSAHFLQSMEEDSIEDEDQENLIYHVNNIHSKINYLQQNFSFSKTSLDRLETKVYSKSDEIMEILRGLLGK